MYREAVRPPVDHVEVIEAQVFESITHGGRHRRRGTALDLESIASTPTHQQQVELDAVIGAPEVELVGLGTRPASELLDEKASHEAPTRR